MSNEAWQRAVKWIEDNGGYVNPSLRYDGEFRILRLGDTKNEKFDDGTRLLDLPDQCLLTLHSVENDVSFGKKLFEVVHSLLPQATTTNKVVAGDDDCGLHHNEQDIILALYLAHLTMTDAEGKHSFYSPYLATLPSHASKILPRQWSDNEVQRRLSGTSLYSIVLKEKRGIEREYRLIWEAWSTKQLNNSEGIDADNSSEAIVFPSFEQYSHAMAMVTSRGFEGLGADNVDAMIPLLDMLNHIRGPTLVGEGNVGGTGYDREAAKDENLVESSRPDVHYKRDDDDDAGGEEDDKDHTPSKRQKTAKSSEVCRGGSVGGGVLVYTSRCLSSGSTLRMTYGAKGNATLLGRYGFAILNNVEPDGSCNDVLEIEIKENEYRHHVKLQRGPKSYSYGPFVSFLELCRGSSIGNSSTDDAKYCTALDEGFDDFLESCDDEGDDVDPDLGEDDGAEDDFSDSFYEIPSKSNDIQSFQPARMLKDDICAIDALKEKLHYVRTGLINNSLTKIIHRENRSHGMVVCEADMKGLTFEDQYSQILILSEIHTVDFFLAAAAELRHRLVERLSTLDEDGEKVNDNVFVDGGKFSIIEHDQISSIASTFMSIRYQIS
jgi:hypothetical protein